MTSDPQKHHIRPAARIIHTLGKGLIKDDLAAIVELVKNSYDADSPDVVVKFEFDSDKNVLKLKIIDCGHGMDPDTVINKWLVPGTSDKLERKTSPKKKRQLQGRKGIGRYAAGILGQELFLSTVDENGNKTELLMDWDAIAEREYLDEVEVLVEHYRTKEGSGTHIEILNDLSKTQPQLSISEIWSDKRLQKLQTELRKMLSPYGKKSRDKFSISLEFGDFPSSTYAHEKIEIEPLPLLNLYDYRVYGNLTKSGLLKLTYENQCLRPTGKEDLTTTLKIDEEDLQSISCGQIDFDLRVFDRDPEAIEEIVARIRVKDGIEMNKTDVKKWLNAFNGLGIYRGGFRIRPYGDAEYDWLNLGSRRVDIPAVRIGSNQIIGSISIEPEEASGLEEKSARDGLVENSEYQLLQERVIKILEVLEKRRYNFRVKSGRGRKLVNIEHTLESLFDFDSVVNDVTKRLKKLKVNQTEISTITQKIEDVKEQKAKDLDNIKETIAYYQGQANLGKMVGHILHEGRKPIGYLRNGIPRIAYLVEKIANAPDDTKTIAEALEETPHLRHQTDSLYNLFTSLDPFTYKKSERSKKIKLADVIHSSLKLFEHDLSNKKISVSHNIDDNITLYGRATDFGWIFSNIIENSIYWLSETNNTKKNISIEAKTSNENTAVTIHDNGPGTTPNMLENGKLFEPGISLKNAGTGMGLALVGELVKRNKGEVWASEVDEGMSLCVRLPATKESTDEH